MSVHMYMKTPVLFIDFDQTLVHTVDFEQGLQIIHNLEQWATHEDALKEWDGATIRYDGKKYMSFCRPGARRFMLECMALARTVILTQGATDFQKKVAVALHIPFAELFGRSHAQQGEVFYEGVPRSKQAILVDDHDPYSELVLYKIRAIGLTPGSERFLRAPAWTFTERKDSVLQHVLKGIRTILSHDQDPLR